MNSLRSMSSSSCFKKSREFPVGSVNRGVEFLFQAEQEVNSAFLFLYERERKSYRKLSITLKLSRMFKRKIKKKVGYSRSKERELGKNGSKELYCAHSSLLRKQGSLS